MKDRNFSRRRFLASAAKGAAAAPFIPLVNIASAQDLPQVSESEPTAVALQYKHDAAETAAPEGRHCANCLLYQGEAEAEWGPCQLFPGKVVAAAGWCTAWAAQP